MARIFYASLSLLTSSFFLFLMFHLVCFGPLRSMLIPLKLLSVCELFVRFVLAMFTPRRQFILE